MSKIYTVRDLKKALSEISDDLPLIYAHDDEGNEFQRGISLPSITYVRKQKNQTFRYWRCR